MVLEIVRVADICEYNWRLGNRCELLGENGMSEYRNTEEEIVDFLHRADADPESFTMCSKYSRCARFLKSFELGETPFNDADPVKLLEFGGKYWVREGKHRVCMAKRARIETIEAIVQHLDLDYMSLRDEVGTPGTYSFEAQYGLNDNRGDCGVLWVVCPRGQDYSVFANGPVLLNGSRERSNGKVDVIPGISVVTNVSFKKRYFRQVKVVKTTVSIAPNHHNTKVWLCRIPISTDLKTTTPVTLYRRGMWRNHHTKGMLCPQWPYDVQ